MTTQAVKTRSLLVAVTVALFAPVAAFAQGQVFKYKDSGGQTHYSDRAPSDAQQVRAPQPPKANTPTAPAAAAATPGASAPPPALPVSTAQANQVQQDVAKSRAEQCTKLRASYDQAVRAQRVYRTNDKGEREFLNAAEADTMRLQIKAEMDGACGN